MKKWLSLFLIGCLLLCACGNKQGKYQEKYDLGVKYLSEGNYEEAVIAFTAAIEIDAKQAAAYVGRGDSYMGLAEQISDAVQRESYYDNAAADYQMAIDLGDDAGTEKLQQVQVLVNTLDFLQRLYIGFDADDLDIVQELMNLEIYKQIAESIEGDYLYYDDEESGVGLAIYPNYYSYFGQWENGKRSGEGKWICTNFEDDLMVRYMYDGMWRDDLPNGAGFEQVIKDEEKVIRSSNQTTALLAETTGNFQNGYEHGVMQMTWYMDNGHILNWRVRAIDGIYQPLENVGRARYQGEYDGEGQYIVAIADNGYTSYWSSAEERSFVMGLGINENDD